MNQTNDRQQAVDALVVPAWTAGHPLPGRRGIAIGAGQVRHHITGYRADNDIEGEESTRPTPRRGLLASSSAPAVRHRRSVSYSIGDDSPDW